MLPLANEQLMAKFLCICWLVEMKTGFLFSLLWRFQNSLTVFRTISTVDGAVFCLGLKDCHKLTLLLWGKLDFRFQTDSSKTATTWTQWCLNLFVVCGRFPLDVWPPTITVFLTWWQIHMCLSCLPWIATVFLSHPSTVRQNPYHSSPPFDHLFVIC